MKRSLLNILTCYIIWGLLPIYWKQVYSVGSVYVLAMRIFLSLVLCILLVLLTGRLAEVKRVMADKKLRWRLAGAGVAVSVNWGCYIYAVSSGHILDASLAYYINPLMSILIGFIVFREKLSPLQWLSVLLALSGVLVPVIEAGRAPVIALVIALAFAIYGALKKGLQVDSIVSLTAETAFVTPIALIIVAVAEFQGMGILASGMGNTEFVFLMMAGAATSVPLMFYAAGCRDIPISLAGILMYINPTIQLLVGVFLYHEAFTLTDALMFGLVLSGVALFLIESARKRKNA